MLRSRRSAFTLIELLIVVGIIAILALIAVPNFLAAQVRAKVSRVKADHRGMALGVEAYAVDHNAYPSCFVLPPEVPEIDWIIPQAARLIPVTTPVAYMSAVPAQDPFATEREPWGYLAWYANYEYRNYLEFARHETDLDDGFSFAYANLRGCPAFWFESRGPDAEFWYDGKRRRGETFDQTQIDYDPTNGVRSYGDIRTFGSGRAPHYEVEVEGRVF